MSVSKPVRDDADWPGYSELTCHEAGHTWNPSCVYSSLEFGAFVLYEGFKIYLPLFLVSPNRTCTVILPAFKLQRWPSLFLV